jgi:hypothetical protein
VSGQPKTWADLRAVVLHRDGYVCQICKVADATDADHIWPRVAGGPDRLENLQAACGPCNKRKGGAYNVFFATEQQLMWLQNHQNAALAAAAEAAATTRGFVGSFAAGLSGDDRAREVIDVPEGEVCDHDSVLDLALRMIARTSWTGASYGWIKADQIIKASDETLAEAEAELERVKAEWEAARSIVAIMENVGARRLVDYMDTEFDRGTS